MSADRDRILRAQVLVEIGDLYEAEREIVELLEASPANLTLLNLLAKVKHIRGELSQAIACWAQIHAQSKHNELALMCLRSILHLAQDPERGATEFIALGRFQLAKKPAAHLELEDVFRSFVAHRPDEARAACDRLARKYERTDRELHKLAVLANAWIAELSGAPDVACAVLERMGRERGFETDTDRVLALARVYERLGTAQNLEKAAHVLRYLGRNFEKISTLGRLAAIYRKLGRDDEAREYEERYLFAFQRRMHRVSFADAARVASSSYLPFESLARVRSIAMPNVPHDRPARELAIEAFLVGDRKAARELLGRGESLLDAKYLANLDAVEGDETAAARGFVETLRADPDDPRILSRVLERDTLAIAGVADVLRSQPLLERLRSNVDAALRASPLNATLWRNMSVIFTLADDAVEAARCDDRAAALQAAADRDARTVGRVLAAAAFHFVGKAKGLIHQIWVDRTPAEPGRGGFLASSDILGNVTFEMKQSVRNTFFAVREYARSRFPQQTSDILDFDYTYKVTKEDEPSGGVSAGLPSALAFLSVFLQRPVPQDVAFSGVLIADAHDVLEVRSVGDAEYKTKGAYNRNLRMLVLPSDNRADLVGNPQLPRAVIDELVRHARTLDEAVTLTFGEDVWMR